MIFINASNVHQGGGKVLLHALIHAVNDECILYSDVRLPLEDKKNVKRIRVQPTILSRIGAEFSLRKNVGPNDQVLCFGNLPLLLPTRGRSFLFFQNMILLEKNSCFKFSWKDRLKHFIERRWLKFGLAKVEKVFVQTESVRDEFLKEFPKANVSILPFIETIQHGKKSEDRKYDFVYVSSGESHKNHTRLFSAFKILADEKIRPSLVVTVPSSYREVWAQLDEMKALNIDVINKPDLSHARVLELYSESRALIYPSLTESFGLPLIEAQSLGLPILASELDFVRDLVSPVETFDPNSARSIARAVRRFLKSPQPPQKIFTAKDFFESVFKS